MFNMENQTISVSNTEKSDFQKCEQETEQELDPEEPDDYIENEIDDFNKKLDDLRQQFYQSDKIKQLYKSQRENDEKYEEEKLELTFLLTEVRALQESNKKLRQQRGVIRKEINQLHKNFHDCKRQEIHEMEMVVGVYDRELLKKWQNAKKSTQVAHIESFLDEVIGKRQAVEYVYKMAEERLASLTQGENTIKKILSGEGVNENEEKTTYTNL